MQSRTNQHSLPSRLLRGSLIRKQKIDHVTLDFCEATCTWISHNLYLPTANTSDKCRLKHFALTSSIMYDSTTSPTRISLNFETVSRTRSPSSTSFTASLPRCNEALRHHKPQLSHDTNLWVLGNLTFFNHRTGNNTNLRGRQFLAWEQFQ